MEGIGSRVADGARPTRTGRCVHAVEVCYSAHRNSFAEICTYVMRGRWDIGDETQILGAILFVVGLFLVAGNLSGAFPTFPFAAFVISWIGGILMRQSRSARSRRYEGSFSPWHRNVSAQKVGEKKLVMNARGEGMKLKLTMLLRLAVIAVSLVLPFVAVANGESQYLREYTWTFDVQNDSDVYVIVSIINHPSWGTWTDSGMNFYTNVGETIENFRAYDEGSGDPLRVSFKTSERWTNCTIYFSKPQGDGYRFRVEFLNKGEVKSSGSDLSLEWGWGGSSKPLPQTIRILLPMKYDFTSAQSDGKNLDYARSIEKGRVVIKFQGVAPASGYFSWSARFHHVPTITTVVVTTTTRQTVSETGIPVLAGAAAAFMGLIVFAITRTHYRSKLTEQKKSKTQSEERHDEREGKETVVFLARLEELREQGKISKEIYEKLKEEYWRRLGKSDSERGAKPSSHTVFAMSQEPSQLGTTVERPTQRPTLQRTPESKVTGTTPTTPTSKKIVAEDLWKWEVDEGNKESTMRRCPRCGTWNPKVSWKCSQCQREFFG